METLPAMVMHILADATEADPMTVYDLIEEVTFASGGAPPSCGSLYNVLHVLSSAGVIHAERAEDGDTRHSVLWRD